MSTETDDYDPAKDAHDSYFAAIAAKRARGDRHWGLQLRIVSPAPATAGLHLSGGVPKFRRGILAQLREHQSAAVYRGDICLAIAMFDVTHPAGTEMALSISRSAAPYLKTMIRMAQLTLTAMAETSPIVATVRPGHRPGERMAAAVGFKPSGEPGIWIFRKDEHGESIRRRILNGETRSGIEPAPAAGGE